MPKQSAQRQTAEQETGEHSSPARFMRIRDCISQLGTLIDRLNTNAHGPAFNSSASRGARWVALQISRRPNTMFVQTQLTGFSPKQPADEPVKQQLDTVAHPWNAPKIIAMPEKPRW